MRLQSRLLKGDPELEACLHHHDAHVLIGAVGEHVSKIQAALYLASGLRIDANELAHSRYGPSTAKAVLEFKRARRIINWAYQNTEDDIVGKMTIAALDMEAYRKERALHRPISSPPRLADTVGRGGTNFPNDIATVGGLLWAAGYGRKADYHKQSFQSIATIDWLPPGPLPLDAVFQGISDFVRDQGLLPDYILTPDSPVLYQLYGQTLALTGSPQWIEPPSGTRRWAICDVAKSNSSGTCQQKYLDETHNQDLKVTPPPKLTVHWCGIYAAWVWRQANTLVYFRRLKKEEEGKIYGGIWRESPNQYLGHSARLAYLAPGDIVVFSPNGGRNHHAIVTRIHLDGTGQIPDLVDLVEGNTGGNPPDTSVVQQTQGMKLANGEETMFYSVTTFNYPGRVF